MLPPTINHQHELLTLNMNDLPIYTDALPGVDVQPLYLDANAGIWCLRVLFQPGVTLPTHYHTGTVHLWTLSGKWLYAEYPDQPQTAGCYLFEPGSSIHTFTTPADNTEVTETLMIVSGTNVNFTPDGQYAGMLDANSIIMILDGLIQERGLEPARYIRSPFPDFTA